MRSKVLLPSALILATMLPGTAAAQAPIFNRYFSGGACYLRLYDAAHMRRNPQQTLSKFHLIYRTPDTKQAKHPREFTVRFGYWVKNAGAYSSEAYCRSIGVGATCSVEADGGSFAIVPEGRNSVRVTLGSDLTVEGQKSFSPNVATAANRVMIVPVTRNGVCQ